MLWFSAQGSSLLSWVLRYWFPNFDLLMSSLGGLSKQNPPIESPVYVRKWDDSKTRSPNTFASNMRMHHWKNSGKLNVIEGPTKIKCNWRQIKYNWRTHQEVRWLLYKRKVNRWKNQRPRGSVLLLSLVHLWSRRLCQSLSHCLTLVPKLDCCATSCTHVKQWLKLQRKPIVCTYPGVPFRSAPPCYIHLHHQATSSSTINTSTYE